MIVQDGASHRRVQEFALRLNRFGVGDVLIVICGGEVHDFAGVAQTNRGQRFHFAHFERDHYLVNVGERTAFTFRPRLGFRQVIEAEHHVLCGHGNGLSGGRREDVVRRQHQHAGFNLRFGRQRNVNRHLIAVKVGVERCTNERVNLDGFAFNEHRLKGLNAQAVQRGSAVQQDGMVLDDFFKDVPDNRFLLLDHLFGLLDGGAVSRLFEPVIDERLEQLERHFLWQTALVQLQLRADHDDGAAGVVHALAEEILAEASLLALQGVGERLQRAVVGAAQNASATSVIEQGIHGFLQHALFVAHDDFGSVQVH